MAGQPAIFLRTKGQLAAVKYNSAILRTMKKHQWRRLIEIGFIIFLFYSNLLMGEFERSGMAQKKGLLWALADIFTPSNFGIAALAGAVGYFVVEFLRVRF